MDFDLSTSHDGRLLAQFAATKAEAPFEALVQRHAAMVYNACLRVLQAHADAEDAAQAVFLTLSRRAGESGLQARSSLAGWLHDSAWHVALRARAAARARARREQEAATMQQLTSEAQAQWLSLAPIVDGELRALPEKYRLPIVLHHLEQHSVEQIASVTHCSLDAVRQRLHRGREMLRERLARQGVQLSGAVVAGLLQSHAGSAVLPVTFAATAAKAAVLVVSGKAVAGVLSQQVLELAREAATWKPRPSLRPAAAAAIAAALLFGGYAAILARSPTAPSPMSVSTGTATDAAVSKAKKDDYDGAKRDYATTKKPDADKPTDVFEQTPEKVETPKFTPPPPPPTAKSASSGEAATASSRAPVVEISASTPQSADDLERVASQITIEPEKATRPARTASSMGEDAEEVSGPTRPQSQPPPKPQTQPDDLGRR